MYAGIDHSTTAVKTAILYEDGSHDVFSIERTADRDFDWSYRDRLEEHVALDELDMIAYGYSYGDAIDAIVDITDVDNRGVVDTFGLGHEIGTGTLIFDELQESDIPCVIFPGIHNGIDSLHPYFKHYRVITGADKFAMARYAQELVSSDDLGPAVEGSSIVTANSSSSSMAVYLNEATIRGAFFWLGLIHGWGDAETFRQVRDENESLRNAYINSGVLKREGRTFEDVKGVPDEELLEKVYWACVQNVYSLLPFAENLGSGIDLIALSGRLIHVMEPFDFQARIESALADIAPVHVCQENSTAIGAAYIARDVYQGASEVLSIPVDC